MTLADRLREAMADAGMTQRELATKCGVKPPSVHGWLSEKSKFLRAENLLRAASVLGVSDHWLATGKGPKERSSSDTARTLQPPLPRSRRVEVRGSALVDKEGFWKELEAADSDVAVAIASDDPDAYAIRIIGIRYHPVIRSGRCVLVEPNRKLDTDDMVLVTMVDGRHTVRDYVSHANGRWMLADINNSNDRMQLADNQVQSVHAITNVFKI